MLARGLPVVRYSDEEIEIAYYGIGLHLGQPVRQNSRGDLLGVVMNVGDPNDKNTRVYKTNKRLPYHTDPSDVVGLLRVRKAKQGGESSLVCIAALYDRLLRDHPEYLGLLYRPFYNDHLGGDLLKMDLCLLSNNKTHIVFCGTDQVTVTRSTMPLANLSYMETAEQALVRQWHERASRH